MKKDYLAPLTETVEISLGSIFICASPVTTSITDWTEDDSWGSLF